MARNETVRINPFAVMPRGGGMSGSTLFTVLLVVLAFLTFSVATNRTAVGKSWRAFL
jgi:branched-subunit amino acid ABC-type transport system permease component